MYEIEKDIPLPSGPGISFELMPFEKMQPGDSFRMVVPEGTLRSYFQTKITQSARRRGFKVRTRKIEDGLAIRIWMMGPMDEAE